MKKHLLNVAIAFPLTLLTFLPLFSQEILVKDLNTTPGGMRPVYDYTETFCKCGDYLYFVVPTKELWRTDGTPDGTIQLGDISNGYVTGVSQELDCGENKRLYFPANDAIHARELWTSDGTRAGTKLKKTLLPIQLPL